VSQICDLLTLHSKAAQEVLQWHDFSFPKMHIFLTHALEDVMRKSPLRHSNTILGEHGHPAFKRDFKRTDGRDIEGQVTALPSYYSIAYKFQIAKLHETRAMLGKIRQVVDSHEAHTSGTTSRATGTTNTTFPVLMSPKGRVHVLSLERDRGVDRHFTNFRHNLLEYLRNILENPGLQRLEEGEIVSISSMKSKH
jgi:hypothetical protein